MRIIESCDGSRTVFEIVKDLSKEFSLPFEILKCTVLDALNAFSLYYAIKWEREKLPRPQSKELSVDIVNNKNHLSAPLTVLWDITYACNLKCKHCLTSAGDRLKDELSLEEVKEIIDQIVDMKVFNICFLGGEPLMRNDFLEILEYATKSNIGITFSTNGSLINNEVIRKLERLKVFSASD